MIDVSSDTPWGQAIKQAQSAMASRLYQAAAELYAQALKLSEHAPDPVSIRRALWIEHVDALLVHEQLQPAVDAAQVYLAQAKEVGDLEGEFDLHLLDAEARAAQNDWSACRQAVEAIDNLLPQTSQSYAAEPTLVRLRGLLAIEAGNWHVARLLLSNAKKGFAETENQRGLDVLENDLRRLELLSGDASIIDEVLSLEAVQSTTEYLLYARALRRDARYETAARLLEQRLEHYIEPALRFPVLHELVLLYQVLGNISAVDRLLPLLKEAAAQSGDPAESGAAVTRLEQWQGQGFTATHGTSFEARLHTVRALIQDNKLDQAERQLNQLRPAAESSRFAAYWSLVAGELAFAQGMMKDIGKMRTQAEHALQHLIPAADAAQKSSLPEVYTEALRLIGRVYAILENDLQTASDYWIKSSHAEELIAHRQETDAARTRYLESVPTADDEFIEAAATRARCHSGESVAGVLAALEAARGAAILSAILPSDAPRLREVPLPNDTTGCWQWYSNLVMQLPRNQALWLLHATPERLHHCLVGYGLLHWVSVPIRRHDLFKTIDQLRQYWISSQQMERSVQEAPDSILSQVRLVAQLLRLDLALAALSKRFSRIAIVAGQALGEIPFAALPLPHGSGEEPLICKYAVSDLPCLSAYVPLASRSMATRGDTGLLVRPPARGLQTNEPTPRYTLLQGDEATIDALDRILQRTRFPVVWIDCHGTYSYEEAHDSWLQFAPQDDPAGRLTAGQFQSIRLDSCGTLVLGACESGMFRRVGRDERIGFVRAGFMAGASAVLAARWAAADRIASAILMRFQRYLRYLPRDQALQRCQLDIHNADSSAFDGIPYPAHPARWACWTLYGSSHLQTSSGPIIRVARRLGAWAWRS